MNLLLRRLIFPLFFMLVGTSHAQNAHRLSREAKQEWDQLADNSNSRVCMGDAQNPFPTWEDTITGLDLFPKAQRRIWPEAERLLKLSTLDVSGFPRADSPRDEDIQIAVPARGDLIVAKGQAVAALELVHELYPNLTPAEAVHLMKKSTTYMIASYENPRMHGSGVLNVKRLIEGVTKLKNQCGADLRCRKEKSCYKASESDRCTTDLFYSPIERKDYEIAKYLKEKFPRCGAEYRCIKPEFYKKVREMYYTSDEPQIHELFACISPMDFTQSFYFRRDINELIHGKPVADLRYKEFLESLPYLDFGSIFRRGSPTLQKEALESNKMSADKQVLMIEYGFYGTNTAFRSLALKRMLELPALLVDPTFRETVMQMSENPRYAAQRKEFLRLAKKMESVPVWYQAYFPEFRSPEISN